MAPAPEAAGHSGLVDVSPSSSLARGPVDPGRVLAYSKVRRRVAAEPQQPEVAAAGVRLICGVGRGGAGERPIGFVRLKASARLPLRVSEQLHALVVKHGLDLDTYVANGLVRAYSVAEDAMWAFDAMVGEGFEPGGAALASVLSVRTRSGGLEMGRRVHELMEERGMMAPVGVILSTALVDMLGSGAGVDPSGGAQVDLAGSAAMR